MKIIESLWHRLRRAAAGLAARASGPVGGRRTAPGHPVMALFRWVGVIVPWAILFSLLAFGIVLLATVD